MTIQPRCVTHRKKSEVNLDCDLLNAYVLKERTTTFEGFQN